MIQILYCVKCNYECDILTSRDLNKVYKCPKCKVLMKAKKIEFHINYDLFEEWDKAYEAARSARFEHGE
jgi:uncharacterized C2H2 Zn-finger protein